jgi:molybdopterin/thiamine biosynthesis adenylyltransferase
MADSSAVHDALPVTRSSRLVAHAGRLESAAPALDEVLAPATCGLRRTPFDFREAFSRNIGWVSEDELNALRTKRIAIAGLGGVGGSHLLTLTRLGVGAFHLADFDVFELANFNRQAGATLATIHQPKVDVLRRTALDINPTLDIATFGQGIDASNVDAFLEGVDVYVDSLDFFAVEARRLVFQRCAQKGIPAITAAPLGMSSALLTFMPGGMTFEEYFQLEGLPQDEQLLRFMVGLAPGRLHSGYLVDPTTVDLVRHRGPSTPMGIELCAGMAASQVLRILLQRGKVMAAPWGVQFDAYQQKLVRTWRPGGNRHPLQKLAIAVGRRVFARQAAEKAAQPQAAAPLSTVEQILDMARWAPSGDNTQPWKFQIVSPLHVVVHGSDTRDFCVYDLDGRPSQLALGALLQTIEIAASWHGLETRISRRPDVPQTAPLFDVHFTPSDRVKRHPLMPYIRQRVTQRRPMRTTPLTAQQKQALEAAAGPDFQIVWMESPAMRRQIASLLSQNAQIRLTIREAYEVHRHVIQWNCRYSNDKLPDQAIGMDPVGTRLMRFAMGSWNRVSFMNRFMMGTALPRLQLDVLPALKCAAHYLLVSPKPLETIDDYLAGGAAMQRVWLTAAQLNLMVQPEMTPLIFARYVRDGLRFCESTRAFDQARAVAKRLYTLVGDSAVPRAAFMGRIGSGPLPRSRSLRLPLDCLRV